MKKLVISLLSVLMVLGLMMPVSAESFTVKTVDEFLKAAEDPNCTAIVLDNDLEFTNAKENQIIVDLTGKTLDLNAKTIKSNHFALIFDGSDFVIKNGNIASLNNSSYPLFIGEGPTKNVVVENVVVINGGINIYNSDNVILRNTNASTNDYYAIWVEGGSKVTVEGGKYNAGDKGNTLLGMTDKNNGTSLTIQSGEFVAGDLGLVLPNGEGPKPVFNGGTFDKNPLEFVADNKAAVGIDDKYVVGETADVVEQAKHANTSVEVLKGIDKLDEIPLGVTVSNKTGNTIEINGRPVEGDGTIQTEDPSLLEVLNLSAQKYRVGDVVEFKVHFKPASYDLNKVVLGEIVASNSLFKLWIKEGNDWKELTGNSFGELTFVEGNVEFKMQFVKAGQTGLYFALNDKTDGNSLASTALKLTVDEKAPVCKGPKDKNCDGVVTCEEEMGKGWTWNNSKKVCEYTGSYVVVNTAAK